MAEDRTVIQLGLSNTLLTKIDDYRFTNRLPSRTAAIRELIEKGLMK